MILAGDVGGTKTHLALFEEGASARRPVLERRLPSRSAATFRALVDGFLAESGARPRRAVFGIAGPVVENRVETTNLPWTIAGDELGDAIGANVRLLNDLEATAHGVLMLEGEQLDVVQRGTPLPGNRALIAAGTGLGEALLVRRDGGWIPTASEGGHTDFAARDPLEDELGQWLRARYGRVSYERVLSGPGLADLHRFLRDTGRGHEPDAVRGRFDQAADPAVVVTESALDGSCERARIAVELFVTVYGAEAGNLALKALAVSGVYIGGGIAPRMVDVLSAGRFRGAFEAKGRMSAFLAPIPAYVILATDAALKGAAAALAGRLAEIQPSASDAGCR
jgi:glucokinase